MLFRSWDAADGWSAAALVEDLVAFLGAVGLGEEPVHLGGFSMGGHTALAFAAAHPERIRSLLLAGVSTQPEPRASVARRS